MKRFIKVDFIFFIDNKKFENYKDILLSPETYECAITDYLSLEEGQTQVVLSEPIIEGRTVKIIGTYCCESVKFEPGLEIDENYMIKINLDHESSGDLFLSLECCKKDEEHIIEKKMIFSY